MKTFDEELDELLEEFDIGGGRSHVWTREQFKSLMKALINKHLGEELVWEPDMTYGPEQVKIHNYYLRSYKKDFGVES